ncbi:MAG: hypothetical protein HW403_651, partial [Dehalococcoidia bacterium]|nr:hypothetical protein [Dehalococcoidia bacterium]
RALSDLEVLAEMGVTDLSKYKVAT